MWGDGIFNKNRFETLGIKHKKIPAIAFNFFHSDRELVYPEHWPITSAKVKLFIEDYLEHKYDYGYLTEKYDYAYQKQKKSQIY